MGILLLVVVGSLSWIAYVEVERVLLSSAEQRLDGAQRLLSDALSLSLEQRARTLEQIGRRSELAALLLAPDDSAAAAAIRVISAGTGSTGTLRGMEIWGADGECRVALAGSGAEPLAATFAAGATPSCTTTAADAALAVGPLRIAGAESVYRIAAPIVREDGSPLGRLVEIRALSESQTAALIEGLIGSDADVFLGNASGDVWSDLAGPVAGPPVEAATAGLFRYADPEGAEHVGVAGPLAGTPWLVWVQFPRPAVLAPLYDFTRPFGIATAMFLLLGTMGAWLVGSRIARPLRAITDAAEEMAAGRYGSRVTGGPDDETGRLAVAFNQMAERIEAHHRELEDRVAERTRELQGALEQLEEAQDQLVRREKLATLGQLSSSVGHELRNPLGVMSNAVYYLEMVLGPEEGRVKEYLEILRGQIVLSEKIVEDLLDFARVKPPQKEPVPLERLVGDQLERLVPPDGLEVVSDLPPDLPPALIDRVQIGQVVLNLLSNAFQAIEEGTGTVTLRGSLAGAGHIRLEVTDTGEGIEPRDLERIFEPLFTTKARGIGLGLSVARSLAEANGGALTASSRPGAGATFTLTLPTSEAA